MRQEHDSEVLDLVKRKDLLYSYKYMCHIKKFNETLPCKNEFYSPLGGKGIIDKEYQYILEVWNEFGMKKRKNYHD